MTWRQDQPADPYQELGVGVRADRDEIVRAYRQRARTCHPDAHPGDPGAAARFRALTLAYQLLADPARRARYDRAHPERGSSQDSPPAGRPPRQAPAAGRPPLWAGPVLVEPPAGGREPRADRRGRWA
jgi:curved DNA-binding protein CbpA